MKKKRRWDKRRWDKRRWDKRRWDRRRWDRRRRAARILLAAGFACYFSALSLSPETASAASYTIRIDTLRPVMRVYRDGRLFRLFPVALGKPATATPVGTWRIVDKQRGWGKGFGTRWLGLNVPWGIYGIHGTNRPASIGRFASNGCVRMRNQDVEQLYDWVPRQTPVIITGDPLRHLRRLEYGNIGADVLLVQRRLRQTGYSVGPCNGRFEIRTQFALMYFELAHGLTLDGVVGLDDYRALGVLGRRPSGDEQRHLGSVRIRP